MTFRDAASLRKAHRVLMNAATAFADAATEAEDFEFPKKHQHALEALERASINYSEELKRAGRR